MLIQDGKIPQRTYHVEWDAGVHYEFLISIAAYCEKEYWEALRSEQKLFTPFEQLTNIPESLQQHIQEIESQIGWGAILATSLDQGPRVVSSVQEYLQWFTELSPLAWYAGLLKHYIPSNLLDLDTVELAACGNPDAKQRLQQALSNRRQYEQIEKMFRIKEDEWIQLQSNVIKVSQEWYERYFAPLEERLKDLLEKGLKHAQRTTRNCSSEQCVFTVTRGIEYLPEPGIWTVRLIPQYHFRPFNFYDEYRDSKIFFFPIHDEVIIRTDEAAVQELTQAMRCLGDENRLRVIQFLNEGDKTFGEIVQYLGISKSTVHHHMATLRNQGFVTIRQIEEEAKYQLRKDRWDRLAQQVQEKLGFGK